MKKIFSAFLVCLIMLSFVPAATLAAEEVKGIVSVDSTLNVRSGPGVGFEKIASLNNGDTVTILGSADSSSGEKWYRISFSSGGQAVTGYAHSDYIVISDFDETDDSFERYLDSQGFPESYRTKLRLLHRLYPNWIFKAQKLEVSWSEALAAEQRTGVNLVSSGSPDSWKSVDSSVYDRNTGKWKGLDGDGWVAASEEVVAYYLDPRNFLSGESIFMFMTQSFDEKNHTAAGIKKVINGTFLDASFPEDGYAAYTDVLLAAAAASGVNPYVLASMIIVEQGTGGSGLSISGTVSGYEGLYNYLNIGAYASGDMDAVQRGLWWASGAGSGSTSYDRPWNTRLKSIVGSAKYYGSNYIAVGQDNLYLKKFDLVDGGNGYYSHQYMTNIQGAASEAAYFKKAYASLSDTALVFNIPVFDDIPDELYVRPTADNTVDARLLNEDISGLPDISDLSIDDKAEVENLLGRYAALNDSTKSYVTNYEKLLSAKKQIDFLVEEDNRRDDEEAVKKIIEKIEALPGNITADHLDIISDAYAAYGALTSAQKNKLDSEYKAALVTARDEWIAAAGKLLGDVDCNGTVNVSDMIMLKNVILYNAASGEVLLLGDLNTDGTLAVSDMIMVKNIIMNG